MSDHLRPCKKPTSIAEQAFPVVFLLSLLGACSSSILSPDPIQIPALRGPIQLEIPEYGDRLYSPGILRVPEPQRIQQIVIHIPGDRVQSAFPKLNALGTGLVQHVTARDGEVLYAIDLTLHQAQHYSFGPEANTIEIKVIYYPRAEPVYVKWVVLPPEEGESWITDEGASTGVAARSIAEMSSEGVVILEEQKDGSVEELKEGWTAARRVFVQARFARKRESVSLRILQTGEDDQKKVTTAGVWRSGGAVRGEKRGIEPAGKGIAALEAPIELELGKNRLEVEVLHGYTTLSRTGYRITRRTPTDPREISGNKWAVVIGISEYQADGMDLLYAHRDAKAVRDFLVDRGGFSPDRSRLLLDEQATHEEIRSAFFTFLAATQPDDLVFIFLAGHGVQDQNNPDNFYFLAHDSVRDNLGGTAIPMWTLGDVMNHSVKARHILVMADTCRSGATSERAGVVEGTGLNFFNKYLETMASKRGRLVLTASQAHQNSLELDRLGHGVFTHFLLQGLAGQADDNPHDGVITAGEVVDFVRRAVPKETRGEQHPSFRDVGFDLNLPLSYQEIETAADK